MSEETKEPRTFEDLWLMRETSNAWFDGQVRYENVRNGADPEVGIVDSVQWCVVLTSERVGVCKKTYVISKVMNGHSFSCRIKREIVAEYESMDAFRASEWWDLTMERFAGGDADASWLGGIEVDGVSVPDCDPQWIGYGPSTYVEMEVGSQYRDWLGNTRQDRGHDPLLIRVERMSGELWIQCGEHEVEGTVEEIEAAMTLVERLRDLGIEVGQAEMRIPIPKEGGKGVD